MGIIHKLLSFCRAEVEVPGTHEIGTASRGRPRQQPVVEANLGGWGVTRVVGIFGFERLVCVIGIPAEELRML